MSIANPIRTRPKVFDPRKRGATVDPNYVKFAIKVNLTGRRRISVDLSEQLL